MRTEKEIVELFDRLEEQYSILDIDSANRLLGDRLFNCLSYEALSNLIEQIRDTRIEHYEQDYDCGGLNI